MRRKKPKFPRLTRTRLIIALLVLGLGIFVLVKKTHKLSLLRPLILSPDRLAKEYKKAEPIPTPAPPTPSPSPTPSPTPRPLTFAEMNKLYGPCARIPTLMYHHIQDLKLAEAQEHKSLTVDPVNFRKQMQYLRDRGYTPISASSLIVFFDQGTPLPSKPVLLTFDDGYSDFGTDAAPILSEFGYPAVLFIPTGLMQNQGYLSWSTITSLSGSTLMANHTWSHRNMGTSRATIEKEITLADTQLTERGLNNPKVFAYPYGITSAYSQAYLQTQGYKLAFTTTYGSTLCTKQRFILPRIRIGNAPLSAYGL